MRDYRPACQSTLVSRPSGRLSRRLGGSRSCLSVTRRQRCDSRVTAARGGAARDAAPAGGQVRPEGRGPVPTEEAGALVLRRCRLLGDPRIPEQGTGGNEAPPLEVILSCKVEKLNKLPMAMVSSGKRRFVSLLRSTGTALSQGRGAGFQLPPYGCACAQPHF